MHGNDFVRARLFFDLIAETIIYFIPVLFIFPLCVVSYHNLVECFTNALRFFPFCSLNYCSMCSRSRSCVIRSFRIENENLGICYAFLGQCILSCNYILYSVMCHHNELSNDTNDIYTISM